jgi:Xaa-Pro dipeptidase
VVREAERRYRLIREAAEREGVDAVIAAGSEYTGFEGAVRYLSGFDIVHRYAHVLLPLDAEPSIVFPAEARYVGEHDEAWIEEKVFVDTPGEWLRERAKERGWKRVGVYGLDYVMNVRDYRALAAGPFELVPFDEPFDLARAVKSEAELESVRDSVRINEAGMWETIHAYAPGKTEAEIMAPSAARFVELGIGRHGMNMVLSGTSGRAHPEFKIPSESRVVEPDDLLLYSLEIAGPGGHWVEVSRPLIGGQPTELTRKMMDAYERYFEAAQAALIDGATADEVHRAASRPFLERGWQLGHVTGHSIGMTMIEHPRIGAGIETVLRENMVLSMHQHVISQDGLTCLYMQDTFRVGRDRGEALATIPLRIFGGG